MAELFASGQIAIIVLALMALEGAVLFVYRRATGRGVPIGDLAAILASGACLTLALYGALADLPWRWIVFWLTAALIAHLADLRGRWR